MPIYLYQCTDCGHRFEALQKMSDPRLTDCPECQQASLKKQLTAAAFKLKGTGWYETDFKNSGKKPEKKATAESSSSDDKGSKTSKGDTDSKGDTGSKSSGSESTGSKSTGSESTGSESTGSKESSSKSDSSSSSSKTGAGAN